MNMYNHSPAFALPVVMIASVVMMMVLVSGLSATTSVNSGLRQQHNARLQKSAAEAGLAMAKSCIKANNNTITWTNASPLRPNTDCNGTETTSCPTTSTNAVCYVSMNGNVRTTFVVGVFTNSQSGALDVESKGISQSLKLSAGTITRSSESTLKLLTSAEFQPEDANFENPSRTTASIGDMYYTNCCQSGTNTNATHSCAIADTRLFCWGSNGAGQLGDGTTTARATPVTVNGLLSGKRVSAVKTIASVSNIYDVSTTCAIADGTLYCWGNSMGSAPQAMAGALVGKTVSSVSATAAHMFESEGNSSTQEYTQLQVVHYCAIAASAAHCWGNNGAGQLGDGTTSNRSSPILVGGLLAGKSVTVIKSNAAVFGNSDRSDTCAIADGRLYCWGYSIGNTPQLITGAIGTKVVEKISLSSASLYDRVLTDYSSSTRSAYTNHKCAIAEGSVYCWGSNTAGQLGDGTTTTRTSPVLVGGLLAGKTATSIYTNAHTQGDVDYSSTCAIADSQLYCWGAYQNTPQLMVGSLSGRSVTDFSRTGANVSDSYQNGGSGGSINGNNTHSCAVADSTLHCWGSNGAGQIGDGTTTAKSVPVQIGGALAGKLVTSVVTRASLNSSSDNSTTCAVADSQLYCWGAYQYTPQLVTGAIGTSPLMAPGMPPPLVRGSILIY